MTIFHVKYDDNKIVEKDLKLCNIFTTSYMSLQFHFTLCNLC